MSAPQVATLDWVKDVSMDAQFASDCARIGTDMPNLEMYAIVACDANDALMAMGGDPRHVLHALDAMREQITMMLAQSGAGVQ